MLSYKIKRDIFYISDPAHGLLKYIEKELLKQWLGNNATDQTEEGIALLLELTAKFYNSKFETKDQKFDFQFLSKYLFKYKRFLWQLVIGLIAASLLQLVFLFSYTKYCRCSVAIVAKTIDPKSFFYTI